MGASPANLHVAVLGSGNVGQAAAACFSERGARVTLIELPAFAQRLETISARGGISLRYETSPARDVAIDRLSASPARDAGDAEVLFLAAPAYGHGTWLSAIAEALRPNQTLVVISYFAALYARAQLQALGAAVPILVELASSPFAGRAPTPGQAHVTGEKRRLAAAALPHQATERTLARLAAVLPQLQSAESVLHTSIGNLNPVIHVPMMLLNLGRVESDDPSRWTLYGDGASLSVAKLMLALDAERRHLGERAGVSTPSLAGALAQSYPDVFGDLEKGPTAEALSARLRASTVHANPTLGAATGLDYRYISEDVPFAVIPWSALAFAWSVAAPMLAAVCQFYAVLRADTPLHPGLNLTDIRLAGLSPEQVLDAVT